MLYHDVIHSVQQGAACPLIVGSPYYVKLLDFQVPHRNVIKYRFMFCRKRYVKLDVITVTLNSTKVEGVICKDGRQKGYVTLYLGAKWVVLGKVEFSQRQNNLYVLLIYLVTPY